MFAARILVEIILVLLLAYGFWHEEDIAAWERRQLHRIIRKFSRKKRKPSGESRRARGM